MLLKVLTDSIFKVFDDKGNEIPFSHKEVKMYKAKYSSVGNESKVLFLDGKPLTNLKKKSNTALSIYVLVERIIQFYYVSF